MTGWRTVLANGIMALVVIADGKFQFLNLAPEEKTAIVGAVIVIVNLGLRAITKTAIFKKLS
jgi:hypothetical protein